MRLPQLLDIGGHMHRLDVSELVKAASLAPAEKIGNRPDVGCPGVAVADGGGEELDEAAGGVLAGGGHLPRDQAVPPRT